MSNISPSKKIERNKNIFYKERMAGGFSHVDSTIEFYTRLNSLLDPEMKVLDFGAGRGAQLIEVSSNYVFNLIKLKGKVKFLVGVDIDPAVMENPFLDEARIIDYSSMIEFDDGYFDLIFADWVLEHVDNPKEFEENIYRLLKPGGWFCARTPNRWGITGLATNLIPNRFHKLILRYLQPNRKEIDVFPTTYKLNTKMRLNRFFNRDRWNNFSYISNSEPPYVSRSKALMILVFLYWRIVPSFFYTNFFVFLRKKDQDPIC